MGYRTLSDPKAELARLRELLVNRDGKGGFAENCKAIRAKIAELEAAPK